MEDSKDSKENENLVFWNSVEKTNPSHTKSVNSGGRNLTAINAQQQIKNATEHWGKYGHTWGLKDIKLDYVNGLCNSQILAVAQAVFYYPDGAFEIGSSILVQSWIFSKSYNKVDDDFLKKLETDMTTKSLSKLGFNADVFLGYYDDNKYVVQMENEFGVEKPQTKANPDNELPWFNHGTKDWENAVDKKATVKKIKEHYRVGKANEAKYLEEIA